MVPDLGQHDDGLPRGSEDLGNGYALLRARDRYEYTLNPAESAAVKSYLHGMGSVEDCCRLIRWARLRLPNGQTA